MRKGLRLTYQENPDMSDVITNWKEACFYSQFSADMLLTDWTAHNERLPLKIEYCPCGGNFHDM